MNDIAPDPIDTLLRRIAAEQTADAPVPHHWDEVGDLHTSTQRATGSTAATSRRPFVLGLAAALVAVLIGGLVLATRDGGDEIPAAPVTYPVPLTEVGEIPDRAWIVSSVMPVDSEYTYALRTSTSRSVSYGDRSNPERHRIVITDGDLATDADEVVRIGSRDWYVHADPDTWSAVTRVGDQLVIVTGDREFALIGRDFLQGLSVVGTSDLPAPPLDPDSEHDLVAEFRTDPFDLEMSVSSSNGIYCIEAGDDEGRSVGCGTPIDVSGPVANVVTGDTVSSSFGVDRTRVLLTGVTSTDVATVIVEFVDGSTVDVTPTDLSGSYDVRFWIAAAEIAITELDPEPGTPEMELTAGDLISAVRAVDADGNVLQTSLPWVAAG